MREAPVVIVFALVSVPVEDWLGTARWLVVFLAGHVGATLLTALGIYAWTNNGAHDRHLLHTVDVGVSYGLYTIAAVLIYRLPNRWRVPYAVVLIASLSIATMYDATFTDIGHLCAVAIGFACYPLTRDRARRSRADLISRSRSRRGRSARGRDPRAGTATPARATRTTTAPL